MTALFIRPQATTKQGNLAFECVPEGDAWCVCRPLYLGWEEYGLRAQARGKLFDAPQRDDVEIVVTAPTRRLSGSATATLGAASSQ